METPYQEQGVLLDVYLVEPDINPALYWIRSQMNPLMDDPDSQAPGLMNTVSVIDGTDIVTVVHENYDRH